MLKYVFNQSFKIWTVFLLQWHCCEDAELEDIYLKPFLISLFQDMDELLSAIRETQVLQTSTQVTRNAPDQDYLTWNWDLISLILEVCSVIGKRKNIICCAFFLCNVLLQMMSLLVVYHFEKHKLFCKSIWVTPNKRTSRGMVCRVKDRLH